MAMMRPGFKSLLTPGKAVSGVESRYKKGWKGMAEKRPGAMKNPANKSAIRVSAPKPMSTVTTRRKSFY